WHLHRRWHNRAGPRVAMFALTSAGVRVTPSAFADTWRKRLPSPLTLSWLLAVQPRGAAAGDERCADRVRAGRRPGGRWLRRNPRSAGRQRYWLYAVRIRLRRQMAGAA